MSVLIFRLNDVSEEEADAVRELLQSNDFDFYESSPGRWGLSWPACGCVMSSKSAGLA